MVVMDGDVSVVVMDRDVSVVVMGLRCECGCDSMERWL